MLSASPAEAVARAYSRGLLPARLASAMFWRLAAGSEDRLADRSVVTRVRFADAELRLRLPLDRRQNWTTMFGGFARSGDAAILTEFTRLARQARGVVDVGANAGLFTYHAAAVAPNTTIIAVEAISELVDLINENLHLNGRRNARAVNVAASDKDGKASFFVAESDQVSSLNPAHVAFYCRTAGTPRIVDITTIDNVVDGVEHVDLMKIDVEGHELAVLAGAACTLSRHRPVVFLEATRENAEPARDALLALGYRIRRFEAAGCVVVDGKMVPGRDALANYLCEPVDA